VRERLLAAIVARLEAGRPDAIVADEARAELDELLGVLAVPDGLDAGVAYMAGGFHLARAELLGADGEQDWQTAAVLLMPVLLSHPDALPEEVRRWLEPAWQAYEQAGDTPAQALGRALAEVTWLLVQRLGRRSEDDRDGLVAGLAEHAVRLLPAGHEARPAALCALGYALMLGGDPATPAAREERLDRMATVFREAFDALPSGVDPYARCAYGLASALAMKAESAGDRPMMAEAARLFRIAAAPESGGDPDLIRNAEEAARAAEAWGRPGGLLGQMHQALDRLDEADRQFDELRSGVGALSSIAHWPSSTRRAGTSTRSAARSASCSPIWNAGTGSPARAGHRARTSSRSG
jgi:hypothetical protein